MAAEYVFWGCVLLVGYTYVLYPCVLFAAYALAQARADLRYLTGRRNRRRTPLRPQELPAVSMVIPAHNEEGRLEDKLANLKTLDYPKDRLQVIVVSDGSTDRTNEILARVGDPTIETVLLPVRSGKAQALNAGVARACHRILIFSDASTIFSPDSLRQLVRHFADPQIGAVCGALKLTGSGEFGQTEGIYWRYEMMLRLMEARLGATLTASGAIYALRRECYRPLTANDVIDDFVLPMHARKLGYQVLFDPEAEAVEFAGASVRDEFMRRVRIATGSFQALGELARVPLSPVARLSFFSHKVLRWVLPFLMLGALASNALLLDGTIYQLTLLAQLAFYLWAGVGFALRDGARRVPLASLCYFLVAIHAAFLVGFVRFLGRRRETAWQRVG